LGGVILFDFFNSLYNKSKDMAIKFGANQVNNPTPQRASIWLDAGAGFAGIVAAWLMTASYIPYAVSDIIGSVLTGLVIPSLLFFKRFFGDDTKQKNVSIDDVTEIKDKS
jgi:hypothetical protein